MKNLSKRVGFLIDRAVHSPYVVAFSAVLVLIFIGTGVLLIYLDAGIMRDQINTDFNQQQLILARQAAAQIDARLRDVAQEVDGLASESLILERQQLAAAMLAAFQRVRAKGALALGLMDENGGIIQSHGISAAETISIFEVDRRCLAEALGQQHIGSLVVDSVEAGLEVVSSVICTSLPTPDNLTVFGLIDVSSLVSEVTKDIRSGRTGYAWVIDESGMFLHHPERVFIGKNAFTARQERRPLVSFSKINEIMKERMLQGEEGTGTYTSGWHRGMSGEINKLIAYSPVRSRLLPPGSVWSVAVVAPASEVAGVLGRIYNRHFLAEAVLIAGLLIFGVTAFSYQRRLSRSLEARVSRQEEYISSLLESSVDAIIIIDNSNRIKVWNKGAEAVFGYTSEEMVGQTFHCLIPPEYNADEELARISREVSEKGSVRHQVVPRITKDGRRITVDISRTLVRERNGDIAGSIAIIKDITDKTEMDQRIYNTEKLASIGVLAAGVAHEINNPLAIILGFTDLLLEKTPEGSDTYEDLKAIEFNANHAKKVVQDMLGFARVTEGLEDHVDVAPAINAVVDICRNTFMTKKIDLRLNVSDELPYVQGDTREFQQVIFNLINNGVAAMEPTGGTMTISARHEDGQVHVSVADSGSGIPDRVKRQIFDPFFTTKRAGEGTGLGLSLCYGIVKKYGGRMTFTSVSEEDYPGQPSGTTFTVSMPVYVDQNPEKGDLA